MVRVTWWMILGLAASAGFNAACAQLRLPASADLVWEGGWYMASFVVMAYLARGEFGTPWADLVPLRRVSAKLIAPILAITIGSLILSFQATQFCTAILPIDQGEVDESLFSGSLPIQYVTAAVFPAIFEEALDRGIVLQALLATEMSARRAITLSAFLFATAHFDLQAFPGHFLSGVLLGWLFVRTGSLLPGMLMHAAHNAMVVTLGAFVLPRPIANWLRMGDYGLLPAATVWAGLALTVIGVLAFRRVQARTARAPGAGDATSDVLDRAA